MQPGNNYKTVNNDADEIFDITNSDYVLVINSNGELKNVVMPGEAVMGSLPANIDQIFQLFNITGFYSPTLH